MTDVGGKLTPNYVTVRTLNAGLRGGLAKRVSTEMRALGYFILKVNNSEQRFAETIVVGSSKDDPEVMLVARFLQERQNPGRRTDRSRGRRAARRRLRRQGGQAADVHRRHRSGLPAGPACLGGDSHRQPGCHAVHVALCLRRRPRSPSRARRASATAVHHG